MLLLHSADTTIAIVCGLLFVRVYVSVHISRLVALPSTTRAPQKNCSSRMARPPRRLGRTYCSLIINSFNHHPS